MRRYILGFLISLLATIAVAQDAVFEVEELNGGLTPPSSDLDFTTPQSTIESFLFAAEEGQFEEAAHALNLNDLDVAVQAERGPILAEQLATVIDRKVVINWQQLLERPDSLDANASSDNPMAGQARKSLLLAVLDLDGRAVAMRLNRVKPEDGDAVWVFSRQTVDVIEPLFARYGPSQLEKMLPQSLRTDAFLGMAWWEVIGLPLVILLAFLAAYALWRLLDVLGSMQRRELIGRLVKTIRVPAILAVIATVVLLTTSYVFVVSGVVSNILEPIIVILFVTAGMILVVNVIDVFLDSVIDVDLEQLASPDEEDRRALATTISALRRVVIVVAVLLGAGIVLTSATIFQTLGFSLLAAAGGLTLVIGFAAREVLSNILASMQISLNRSARVGDQLIYDDHLCTVERIHFTFVQLQVWDGTRMIVPVSKFVSDEFVNRNIKDSEMTRHATLKVAPQVDVDQLRQLFRDWVENDERVHDAHTAECVVTAQNEFGLSIRFAVPVPDPRDGWSVECDMREYLVAQLVEIGKARGIDLLPHLGMDKARGDDEGDAATDD